MSKDEYTQNHLITYIANKRKLLNNIDDSNHYSQIRTLKN